MVGLQKKTNLPIALVRATLEITPKSLRLRKDILNPHDRKRSEKTGTAA